MGCFLVPMAEAIVVSAVKKHEDKKEAQEQICCAKDGIAQAKPRSIWSRKLGVLNKMLWGGSALLILEHIWHGEVSFAPPFITAFADPASLSGFFMELSTAGIAMSVAVTSVWAVMVQVAAYKERKALTKGA